MRFGSLLSLITIGTVCVNAHPLLAKSEETLRLNECLGTLDSLTNEYTHLLSLLEHNENMVDTLDTMEMLTDSVDRTIENMLKLVCCNPEVPNYKEDSILDIANTMNEVDIPLQDLFDLLSFKKDDLEAHGSDTVERVKKVAKKLVAGEEQAQMCVKSKFPPGYNVETYNKSIHVDMAELEKIFDGYYA